MSILYVTDGGGHPVDYSLSVWLGTQCDRLKETFTLKHISSGDLLRDEVASGSELGQKLLDTMTKGELVPMKTVLGMIAAEMIDAVLRGFKGLCDAFVYLTGSTFFRVRPSTRIQGSQSRLSWPAFGLPVSLLSLSFPFVEFVHLRHETGPVEGTMHFQTFTPFASSPFDPVFWPLKRWTPFLLAKITS